MYEGDDLNLNDATESGEGGNRTFVVVAAVLGGIVLLTIACLAVYALVILPGQRTDTVAQQATLAAQNTLVAEGLTGTAIALDLARTPEATETPSPTPTNTPVVAVATDTTGPAIGGAAETATAVQSTVEAAQTQAAINALTNVPTTTALPDTGFADEIGAPGLLIAAFVLIAVILLVRRLRTVNTPAR